MKKQASSQKSKTPFELKKLKEKLDNPFKQNRCKAFELKLKLKEKLDIQIIQNRCKPFELPLKLKEKLDKIKQNKLQEVDGSSLDDGDSMKFDGPTPRESSMKSEGFAESDITYDLDGSYSLSALGDGADSFV